MQKNINTDVVNTDVKKYKHLGRKIYKFMQKYINTYVENYQH